MQQLVLIGSNVVVMWWSSRETGSVPRNKDVGVWGKVWRESGEPGDGWASSGEAVCLAVWSRLLSGGHIDHTFHLHKTAEPVVCPCPRLQITAQWAAWTADCLSGNNLGSLRIFQILENRLRRLLFFFSHRSRWHKWHTYLGRIRSCFDVSVSNLVIRTSENKHLTKLNESCGRGPEHISSAA